MAWARALRSSRSLTTFLLALTLAFALAPAAPAQDCNGNGIDDPCDLDCGEVGGPCDVPGCGTSLDCNTNSVPDECDLSGGTSADCDGNGRPDECDLALGAAGCGFTWTLLDNSTGIEDARFIGPPNDLYYGLGGQVVTYDFNCGIVVDGAGPDLTIYEIDGGSAEFGYLGTVLVSADGIDFYSIKATEGTAVRIPGDEGCTNMGFARSYDLGPEMPRGIRYLRLDGNGTGSAGPSTGFDLDAAGAVNRIGLDCDENGTLDACETHADCNANSIPDACELSAGLDPDCNANGVIDECDISSATSEDCDANGVPDECQPDCNLNAVADACDISSATSEDCNANLIPDECDVETTTFVAESGPLSPVATGRQATFTVPGALPASADVTLSIDAVGDFDATNEYLSVTLNAAAVGNLLEEASTHCATASDSLVIPADTFNSLTHGGEASFVMTATSYCSQVECLEPTIWLTLSYDAIVDCNANTTIDACDISGGTSTDLNLNGIADDCEEDCNGNAAPDDYDIAQGTSADCNENAVPDECDVDAGTSLDCNANVIPDECEVDCNENAVPDDCDITAGTSLDCDLNGIPDECDMLYASDGCAFPPSVYDNSTGAEDWRFTGPPDDVHYGLGGQIVTLEFNCGFVADLEGPDITVYEVDSGASEFGSLGDVLVSDDGASFVSIKATESAAVNIPGDEQHGSNSFARSYDLAGTGFRTVRFVRLDGSGTGGAGPSTGFDLDAIGAINRIGRDCDSSGVLDACESLGDCDANGLPDACELGLDPDCNENGALDECDISGGTSTDYNLNVIPDECEPDCNGNLRPDDYDIAQGTSTDCNHNAVPDECDLTAGTSLDCNNDSFPDECPICPLVEVSFIMDTSTSMNDEGAALCSDIEQVVADLEADLIDVDTELMAIAYVGTGIYDCLTEYVMGNYGTTVPGSPPPGNEILGDCPGGNQVASEDWGRATSVVAGNKLWMTDSVRLIVPLSDEGPWCGDPTTDPGVDRDSIVHAIGVSQESSVIVSPVTCSGSSGAMIALAQLLADSTGGDRFASSLPAEDLAEGLKAIIYDACDSINDCNRNDVPDECDIDAGTSADCDLNGRPDECEEDCNANGVKDSCDIDAGTSQDANGNVVPDECEAISLTLDATSLHWTAVDGAIGYDVVEGDLATLAATSGNFTNATTGCLVNDHPGLDHAHDLAPDPPAGEGTWYLVRGVLGSMDMSYDTLTGVQHHARDAEIAAAAAACP
jgi:acetylornithine deacetylase/succinyl-diaminopimelate desuccinylase-like protein